MIENSENVLETLLFACGEPCEDSKLCAVLDTDTQGLKKIADNLNELYKKRNSGLEVIKLSSSYQISTRKEFSGYIKQILDSKANTPLSNAAMEVLTIIAYNQPVSKSFVSSVRGVESGSLVNSLVDKELLCEAGRLDVPGKPVAYKTTENFLRCFGLESLENLEPIPDSISLDDETMQVENIGSEDEKEQEDI